MLISQRCGEAGQGNMATIEWSGDKEMLQRLTTYGQNVKLAQHRVAEYFAPIVETEAKQNAPWTDRTGNARQGLHGFVEDLSASVVAITLAHGVSYGIFLELRNQGRYAIIMPTLEANYQPVYDMLKEIFS